MIETVNPSALGCPLPQGSHGWHTSTAITPILQNQSLFQQGWHYREYLADYTPSFQNMKTLKEKASL